MDTQEGAMEWRARRIQLGGIAIDAVGVSDAVAAVASALQARVRGYVVTPNVDHVVRARRMPHLRIVYEDAWLSLADGMPLVWASRLLRRPLPERTTGADLLPALCAMAAAQRYSVFFLGSSGHTAQRAASNLVARFPGLRVAGVYGSPARFSPDGPAAEAAVAAVAEAGPDLLFVGLGSPKQELFVHRHRARLACTVAICCGAAVDYAAGVRPRAPRWLQRAGLEWLWRLAHEPRRLWRRYLVDDMAFLGIVLREWWQEQRGNSRP
ncbi:MAG: WecB/TagA/CpsF family glycosyltransferase [Armatimonadota bacterium]|nr:WecB/TagA/CpsF family glycosyltransferase [Armatimonadota bacterium]